MPIQRSCATPSPTKPVVGRYPRNPILTLLHFLFLSPDSEECDVSGDGDKHLRWRRATASSILTRRNRMRLHLARELLEREVLVLHLGHELGGLEQPLAGALRRVVPVGEERLVARRGQQAGDAARLGAGGGRSGLTSC